MQPEIIINDRLPGEGDYKTAEQFIPGQPPEGPWEACLTLNESWAYNTRDHNYKSTREIVHRLCEIIGKGGRLLLNVSPMGSGELPPIQVERLNEVTEWLERNHGAIFGTEAGLEPWQFYGPTTCCGNKLYLFLLMKPYESITVRGLPIRKVESIFIESSKQRLDFRCNAPVEELLMSDNPVGEVAISVPSEVVDEYATVIAVELAEGWR